MSLIRLAVGYLMALVRLKGSPNVVRCAVQMESRNKMKDVVGAKEGGTERADSGRLATVIHRNIF